VGLPKRPIDNWMVEAFRVVAVPYHTAIGLTPTVVIADPPLYVPLDKPRVICPPDGIPCGIDVVIVIVVPEIETPLME
jgi:hypothetical protein